MTKKLHAAGRKRELRVSMVGNNSLSPYKAIVRKFISGKLAGPVFLVGARYLTNVVGPLISLLVVRYLGPYDYGVYASAVAITTFFGIVSDFGLQQAALEAFGLRHASTRSILRSMVQLGFGFSFVALAASVLWVLLGHYDQLVTSLVVLLGIEFFKRPILTAVTVGLQVKGMYGRLAAWNLAISSARWIGTVVAMLIGARLYGLIGWPLVISWVVVGFMVVLERSRVLKETIAGSRGRHEIGPFQLLGRSLRFGSSGALHQVYHRFDSVLLSLVRDPLEVGAYSVAFRVIQLLNSLPGVVFNQVLYPKYFQWFRNARARVALYYHLMSKLMLGISVVLASLVSLFSKDVVTLIFGSSQEMAALFLGLMAWSLPGRYVGASAGAVMTTGRQIEKKIQMQAVLAVFSLALNSFAIPAFGAWGATGMLVATDCLLSFLFARAVRKSQKLNLWDRCQTAFTVVLFVVISLLATVATFNSSLPIRILSGLLILLFGLVFVRFTFDVSEKNEILRLLGFGPSRVD